MKKPITPFLGALQAALETVRKDVCGVHTAMSMTNTNSHPLHNHIKQRWQQELERADLSLLQIQAELRETVETLGEQEKTR